VGGDGIGVCWAAKGEEGFTTEDTESTEEEEVRTSQRRNARAENQNPKEKMACGARA